MAIKTVTNYTKHKDVIIDLVSKSSLCYACLARLLCKNICEAKGIDVSKTSAPCREAWEKWCNSKA